MGRHKQVKLPGKLSEQLSGLENEIRKIVLEILHEDQYQLSREDIKEIVSELLPDLDEIISKAIKKHTKLLIGWIDSNLKE